MYTQKIGRFGEDEAVKYLKQKGYKILDRNFSCKRGEIDIVALDKEEIVFIEIKSRVSLKYGLPSEAVTKNKLKHIICQNVFWIISASWAFVSCSCSNNLLLFIVNVLVFIFA